MKQLIILFALSFCTLAAMADPNEKVLSNFNRVFPKADSVSWSESGHEFQVRFVNQGIKCMIWYDEEGNVTRTHRYYLEDMLPPLILSRVQKKYTGKKVFGITEVNTASEGIRYFIVLEDDKKWYNVTSDEIGNLTITQKFNKG
jgi:hypothetical protein